LSKECQTITAHIVWFKRDLRLQDHAPLRAAAEAGDIVPLYIIEPHLWAQPDSSRRHWSFVYESLCDLEAQLAFYAGRLVIRRGEAVPVLDSLRAQLGSLVLWSHEETGNAWTYNRDIHVAQWCRDNGVPWYAYPANGVVRGLKSREGWAKIRDTRMADGILDAPQTLTCVKNVVSDPWPSKDDPLFGASLRGTTQPGGRMEGVRLLESFLKERGRKYLLTFS
jgi:deoxyribodipyrimidine photo-lyase